MECPLARQQHANCPDRLEGNKGDSFSQASEKCGLLVVIFPEETIPSWSRGGAPHPATAVMRTTLIESGKRTFMARRSLQTPRAPRMPPTLVGCLYCGNPNTTPLLPPPRGSELPK